MVRCPKRILANSLFNCSTVRALQSKGPHSCARKRWSVANDSVYFRVIVVMTLLQSLADCTQPMDSHTWNTYHIISNRARSVCYATRQQQFRRQTEMAVNKLSEATIGQLQAMQDLSSSQDQIKQATESSLKVREWERRGEVLR